MQTEVVIAAAECSSSCIRLDHVHVCVKFNTKAPS